MEKLKKGDFIVIKFEKKNVNAKVVAHVPEKGRLNVFTQGTLKWVDDKDFVSMGTPGSDLKRGSVISKPIPTQTAGTDAVANEPEIVGDLPGPSVNIPINETDEMYLNQFRKGRSGKTLTVEQLSDAVGKSTPATKHAVERLNNLGYLDLVSADLQEYALSIRGLKHVPGTARPISEVSKLKTDKKSGEVLVSKKNRVLTLLKNPDLTIKQIAEMTESSQSYIRGIRERSAKKMTAPEEGTVKRKVYDALRAGGQLVEVAKRCKVTISYAYQVKQQMLSAKIL